jgi:hypothetical protein
MKNKFVLFALITLFMASPLLSQLSESLSVINSSITNDQQDCSDRTHKLVSLSSAYHLGLGAFNVLTGFAVLAYTFKNRSTLGEKILASLVCPIAIGLGVSFINNSLKSLGIDNLPTN